MRHSCVCGGRFIPQPTDLTTTLVFKCDRCEKVVTQRRRGTASRTSPTSDGTEWNFDCTYTVEAPGLAFAAHALLSKALTDAAHTLGIRRITITTPRIHPYSPEY